jgi:hypothetical protein
MTVKYNCPLYGQYGTLASQDVDWTVARGASNATSMAAFGVYALMSYWAGHPPPDILYTITRHVLRFDLSPIPSDNVVLAVSLKGNGVVTPPPQRTGYIRAVQYTGADPITVADFAQVGGSGGGDYGYVVLHVSTPADFELVLNALGISDLDAARAAGEFLLAMRNYSDYAFVPSVDEDEATKEFQNMKALSDPYLEVECAGPPLPSGVSPSISGRDQSLEVIISGILFTGATDVDFGAGITVNSYVVDDDTQITAQITVAAGATIGLRDVSVTTTFGTGTLVDGFEVIIPVVSSVYPVAYGRGQLFPGAGVYGQGFTGATVVSFGAGITTSNITVLDDFTIQVDLDIAALAALGLRDVSVTNAVDTGTLVDGFEVMDQPHLTSITPNHGAQGDTLVGVVLVGSGFTQPNLWFAINIPGIGWVEGYNIVIDSDVHVTFDLDIDPAATTGLCDVEVDTDYGWSTLVGGFTVTDSSGAPTVTTVTPNHGVQGQHLATVIITGYDL